MKVKRLFITLVLGLCMAVSGCGKGNAVTENVKPEETESGLKSYEITTVRWVDWGENYHTGFIDELAKEKGMELTWNTILNPDWGDKKAVLMAGGNLPDAFMGSICFSEAEIMNNSAAFLKLDDYIDDYMPNFKKIMEEDPTMRALTYSADGHIYGLPSKKPCRPIVSNQMFINKVWLDNLGLSVPQNYEEFEEVLKAFKDNDANGNGDPDDEIPFAQGYADTVMSFCLPFGTTIGADGTYLMTIKDGQPVFLPTFEGYKDGIDWMYKCYSEGLIDPEIFTEDSSMRDAKLMSETPVVGCASGWTIDATFGSNADQYIALPALEGPDGNRYVSSDPEHWNYSRYEFVITASCEDPGPLLAWADSFYTDDATIQNFYGPFGIGTSKDEKNGTYRVLEPNDGNTADTFAWINSLRDFGPKYVADGFDEKVTYDAENGDALKLELDKDMKQYAREAYPNVSYTPEQLGTLATLYTDIGTYVSSNQAKWVTEGGVNEEWDNYMSTLKNMGYEEFMKIQTEAYENYNSNK